MIVTTAGTLATQRILDLHGRHLLPALDQAADPVDDAMPALAFPHRDRRGRLAPRAESSTA